jgi:hypothetical protein
MTYNELAELFKRDGGDAQVCFSVISQNQILFGNNDTKKDIISFRNDEPIKWVKEAQEEPVSEDLGEYINELSKQFPEVSFAKLSRIAVRVAKWKEEQFEKNRLKHCNSITNEQAELEQKLLDEHLDKYNRMPTYLDAIEYGMRLQKEQMMAKAVDADCFGFQGAALFSFRLPSDKYLVGSKVKVIVIKEDLVL